MVGRAPLAPPPSPGLDGVSASSAERQSAAHCRPAGTLPQSLAVGLGDDDSTPKQPKAHQHRRHVDGGDCVTIPTLSRHDLHVAKSRFIHALLLYLPFASIILDCILKCRYGGFLPETDPAFQNNKNNRLVFGRRVLPSIQPPKDLRS